MPFQNNETTALRMFTSEAPLDDIRVREAINYSINRTGIVKAISFEFGYFGVTANIVVPGGVDTSRDPEDYPPDMHDQANVPKGRPPLMIPRRGSVGELADMCLFLASDRAGYITGQSIHVDGGVVMR